MTHAWLGWLSMGSVRKTRKDGTHILRSGHAAGRQRRRPCGLERLEDRSMLSGQAITGLGVMGDSLSDEYADEFHPVPVASAKSWVELLAQNRAVNVGPTGHWGEPRRDGYKYDWARYGASSGTLLLLGEDTGVAKQASQGLVSHAVLFIGANDFYPGGSAYKGIYNGTWSQSQIDQQVSTVVSNIRSAVQTVTAAGTKLVVANLIDYGEVPLTRKQYTNAAGRDRVAAVISTVNTQIAQMAAQFRVPVADLYGLGKLVLGTNQSPVTTLTVGGQPFLNWSGADRRFAFLPDGDHPNTVLQAMLANTFLTALNQGFGTDVSLFSEKDIDGLVGLPYGGHDTANIPYSSFVILPPSAAIGAGANLALGSAKSSATALTAPPAISDAALAALLADGTSQPSSGKSSAKATVAIGSAGTIGYLDIATLERF